MPIEDDDFFRHLIDTEDIGALVLGLFGHDLTPGQEEIARAIAFPQPTVTPDGEVGARVAVVSPTQYGKTQAFADGLGVRYVIDPAPLVTKGIGPREEQAAIFRNRFAKNIVRQPLLGDMLDVRGGTTVEALKKEVSHKRLTFQDGKEFSIHSAEGDADRVMGEGGDIIVKDEACLINTEAHAKVARMLTANPRAELYELANPWDRENVFFKHWEDPNWRRIYIPLEQAIAEGRMTRPFVEEQRRELAPTMFQVLFLAQFPDIAEDQLIPWSWIMRAVKKWGDRAPWTPSDALGTEPASWRRQSGADIAEGGLDKTVLVRGWKQAGTKRVVIPRTGWRSWQVADTMETAARIRAELAEGESVAVDENGVGKGPADALRRDGVTVFGFKAGRQARNKERFFNASSEAYWLLRRVFEESLIELHDPPQALLTDLSKMRWEVVSGRVKVEVKDGKEGGNSPDHGDALAMLNYSEAGGERIRPIRARDPLAAM